jgi:hypothetical protein
MSPFITSFHHEHLAWHFFCLLDEDMFEYSGANELLDELEGDSENW